MRPYYSDEWIILPHVVLTSDTDWDTSVLDFTKSEYDEIFYTISKPTKIEPIKGFDIHGDCVDRNIVQDTNIHYFGANTYDKGFDFTIYHCVDHSATLQYHYHII